MNSYSQSEQDLFAILVCGQAPQFFLDIGCCTPGFQSNARLLLELGWKGICVDADPHAAAWDQLPGAYFTQADATRVPWNDRMKGQVVAYASVDVDFSTTAALRNLVNEGIRPTCLTVEHDKYRFGPEPQVQQRGIMSWNGYTLVRPDVSHGGCAYEDWYVRSDFPKLREIIEEVTKWSE